MYKKIWHKAKPNRLILAQSQTHYLITVSDMDKISHSISVLWYKSMLVDEVLIIQSYIAFFYFIHGIISNHTHTKHVFQKPSLYITCIILKSNLPGIQTPPSPVNLSIFRFVFECRLQCDTREPKIEWFKDEMPTPPDYVTTFKDGVCSLTIEETFAEDAAKYTCKATTNMGSAETTCQFRIRGEIQL